MTIEQTAKSIEASYAMEGMPFNDGCRKRVRQILSGEIDVEVLTAQMLSDYKSGKMNERY